MPLLNSPTHYGAMTRFLHWAVFLLFVYQYLGANLMTRIGSNQTLFGITQGGYYNWHKSIGLVVLALALLRLAWRKLTPLPDWAPTLAPAERAISHWNETLLYGGMILLPISGYLFVMAGGYGIKLFGWQDLPDPIGKREGLAAVARVAHVVLAYATVVVVAWHVGLGLKHQIFDRDRFLNRMLPFGRR
jgi:cytochrome b561